MLRIVPPNVPRVGRSDEHFPDGFELHLLQVERGERDSVNERQQSERVGVGQGRGESVGPGVLERHSP